MKNFLLLLSLLPCSDVAVAPKSTGTDEFTAALAQTDWVKGMKGQGTITVDAKSTCSLEIYEKYIAGSIKLPGGKPSFIYGWRLVTTVAPGGSYSMNPNGDVQFKAHGRDFKSASDVPHGFDACFDSCWFSWRQ